MKEKTRKIFGLAVFIGIVGSLFLMTNVFAGNKYLVITPTKVFQKPSEKASAVSYLTPETEVEEIKKTSSWIKVKVYDGKVVGWIPVAKLKEKFDGKCKVGDCEEEDPKKKKHNETTIALSPNPSPSPSPNPNSSPNPWSRIIPSGGDSSKKEMRKEEKIEVENVVYVKPNRATMVEMSSLDINRVYCDGEITDVIFSEEKGVRVKIVKNNAFVKFVVRKVEDKEIPIENPVDIFFVCDNQVYSVIAIPKRIPSAFIYLEAKEKKVQETVEKVKDLPYEKRLLEIIRAIYMNKYEPNYQVMKVNKEFNLFKDVQVVLEKIIDIEGEGLRAKVFRLVTNFSSSTQYVEIKEKDFVRKELTSIPLAVSLDKVKLQGKDKATLIILEKRINKE
jgi:conjugal transfer pilus assembly protein TraK